MQRYGNRWDFGLGNGSNVSWLQDQWSSGDFSQSSLHPQFRIMQLDVELCDELIHDSGAWRGYECVIDMERNKIGESVAAEAIFDLERISRQFRPALLAYFRRRMTNHAEAEDMTQEVFIRLAQCKTEKIDSTEAFIFRIATNLLRDRSRRDRVRGAYRAAMQQDELRGIDLLDPHRINAARETLGTLWAAIQALPEPTQQIFILFRVEQIDKRTIADNFGIHVRTVEKHITKAMVFLSRRVGGRA